MSTVISVTIEFPSLASSHVSVLFESQVILGSIQWRLRKGGQRRHIAMSNVYCCVARSSRDLNIINNLLEDPIFNSRYKCVNYFRDV